MELFEEMADLMEDIHQSGFNWEKYNRALAYLSDKLTAEFGLSRLLNREDMYVAKTLR